MRPPRLALLLLVGALVAFVAAAVLLLDNVRVDVKASDGTDGQAPGGEVGCTIAPWDAGVNDNDQGPGGEWPREYYEEVGEKCYAASMARYDAGRGTAALGAVLLGAGVAVAVVPVLTRRPRTGRA